MKNECTHHRASRCNLYDGGRLIQWLVALFVVCFLPFHVFFLWFFFDTLGEYNHVWHGVKIAGFVLAYANSCINPIALYCSSALFRKHFRRLRPCPPPAAVAGPSDSLSYSRPQQQQQQQRGTSRHQPVTLGTSASDASCSSGGHLQRQPAGSTTGRPLHTPAWPIDEALPLGELFISS